MKKFLATLMLLFVGLSLVGCAVDYDIPKAPDADKPVVDLTDTLSEQEINTITSSINNQPKKDDYGQIAVLVVHKIPSGKSIEQASLDVAREWGIGSKDDKNGVLLYIAKDSKKLRLEVADAAGVYLTDAESRRIVENVIAPYFKNKDYFEGIDAGARAIRAEIDGVEGSTYVDLTEDQAKSDTTMPTWVIWVIIVIAVIVSLLSLWIESSDSGGGSSYGGRYGRSSGGSGRSSFGGGRGFSGGGFSGGW